MIRLNMIEPMKAEVMPPDFEPDNHIAEIKYDGHRHLVHIDNTGEMISWSSNCKIADRKMDDELKEQISNWLPGIYDGELHLGLDGTSSDVSRLDNRDKITYTAFDLLATYDNKQLQNICNIPFRDRRELLKGCSLDDTPRCKVQGIHLVENSLAIDNFCEEVWNSGGEGIILKDIDAPYEPGKRRKHFLKVKSEKIMVMIIMHYEPPQTETEFGIVVVAADEYQTSVKVPTLELRNRFLSEDFVGREVLIEYQGLTPYGKLRHPRFDRFADE